MSTANLEEIRDQLSNLTVLEMSKLKGLLEEHWGVEAAAPIAVAAAGAAPAAAEAAEESTEFDVVLEDVPSDKRIAAIKIVREVTGQGLKEAKEIVENAPKTIKEAAAKAEAEEIANKLKEAGAKVTLKGV